MNRIEIDQSEIDNVLKDSNLQNIIFKCAINWMGVLIVYLRRSSCEISPKLVICVNELENSLEDGDAIEIWNSYNELIKEASLSGIDMINLPFQFFGRSYDKA